MFFGINTVSHDLGLCVINDLGEVIFYLPTERFNRFKKGVHSNGLHISNKNKLKLLFEIFNIPKAKKGDVICWVSGDEKGMQTKRAMEEMGLKNLGAIKKNKIDNISCVEESGGIKFIRLDHHVSHAISSWMFRSNNEEKKFLVYDGGGYGVDNVSYCSATGYIDDKKIFLEKRNTIPSSYKISNLLGWMSAGKLMGLAGFYPESSIFCKENPKNMIELSGYYKCFIEELWEAIQKNIEKKVLISGGTALALEINSRIYNNVDELTFGPPVDDSGLCLGCAVYGYFYKHGVWPRPLDSPSIVSLQSPLVEIGPQNTSEIAKILHEGKIIFLMRGLGECGPRSLGHRSILSSCNIENLKLVSIDIKKREFYRPLAPIVTNNHFSKFFIGPMGKYMQYKVDCTEEAKIKLPAIVHKDNSSRPQIVSKESDPWMFSLLVEYGKLSGKECLVNTSLNTCSRPICNINKDLYEFDKKTLESVVVVSIPTSKIYNNKIYL